MTAPVTVVTHLPKLALEALIALGTPKLMLATSSFTPVQDTLTHFSDVTNEAAGTSYSAGGLTMTNMLVLFDAATNKCTIDADNITTAGLSVSCRWAIPYIWTGVGATSPVLAYVDLSGGGDTTCTGINWDAAGIIPFVVA
jgi:hypothetical protein